MVKKKEKKKKGKFNVPNYGKYKRVKNRWRKPRGIDNKKRIRRKEFGASPKVGYKKKSSERNTHPLGLKEIMIYNVKELAEKAKEMKGHAVRISGKVSKRTKEAIRKKAKELGFRSLN